MKTPWKNNEWKLNCDDKQEKKCTVQGSSLNKVKREKFYVIIWNPTQPFIFTVTAIDGREGKWIFWWLNSFTRQTILLAFEPKLIAHKSETYLKIKKVTLALAILLFLGFPFSNLRAKFFVLVRQLVHFSLCFALHINDLFKLHRIIFWMFELKQCFKCFLTCFKHN